MSSDKLKDFIENNREGFDSYEPSDLWQNISGGISAKPALFKTIVSKGWIKYGLSSLLLGTSLTYIIATSGEVKSEQELAPPSTAITSEASAENIAEQNEIPTGENNLPLNENKNAVVVSTENLTGDTTKSLILAAVIKENDVERNNENSTAITEEKPGEPDPNKTVSLRKRKEVNAIVDSVFSGIKKIQVKSSICDVSIKPGTGNEVTVRGNINIETRGIAMNAKNNYTIVLEKNDSILHVNVYSNQLRKPVVVFGVLKSEAFLDFEVPNGVEMVVEGSCGNVSMQDLSAKTFDIKTSFGDIRAERIDADVKLKTSSGSIKAKQITGNIISETQFGDQKYENILGDIMIRSASGDIVAKQVKGKVDARTSFGDQSYEMMSGDLVTNCGSGDIKLDDFKGKLKATSKFGDIKGQNVEVESNTELETTSGDITIDFVNDLESLGFNLHSNSGVLRLKKDKAELRGEKELVVNDKPITIKGTTKFGDQYYK